MENDFQHTYVFQGNAASSNSDTIKMVHGAKMGSIQIITNSTFNGTTTTVALQGSNDNSNWSTVYASDDLTAMSFTLATNSKYTFLLHKIFYKYYRLVYTKGDASAGTIECNTVGKI